MPEVLYVSKIRIERLPAAAHTSRPARRRSLGVHDEIAEHYGRRPGEFEPHAATPDYVVAAAGG